MSITDDLLALLMGKVNGEGGGDQPLTPLTNPALAENILAGKEAYNDQKEVLTGSLTVADLLAALNTPASAGDIAAGKEAYDDQGQRIVGTASTGDTLAKHLVGTLATYSNSELANIIPYAFYIGSFKESNYGYALTSISAPNAHIIGSYAFYNQKNLETCALHESSLSVGQYAFYRCIKLTQLNSTNKVISLNAGCFNGCSSLASLDLSSISVIPLEALLGTALSTLNIPLVTKIGNNGCSDMHSLVSVNAPLLTNIGDAAFCSCELLSSIALSGIKELGHQAFRNSGLQGALNIDLYASDSVYVGSNVFEGTSITSVSITNVNRMSLKSGASYIEYLFKDCANLSSVDFGTGALPSSSRYWFDGCSSLTELTLNNSTNALRICGASTSALSVITKIIANNSTVNSQVGFYSALQYLSLNAHTSEPPCSGLAALKAVSLNSIASMRLGTASYNNNFYGCTNLEAVILNKATMVTLSTVSANNIPGNVVFYVNDDLYESYLTATNWSTITSRIKRYSECPQAILEALDIV